MRRVYIAGKLNDKAVGYIANMHHMAQEAELVRLAGFSVYVPFLDVLMGLMFGYYKYNDFFDNSQPWLLASDAIYVCPGYETSEGTLREIELAKKNGIPVFFSIETLKGYFNV
jgi:hypothetical protein